jgi:hypothetical protein
MKIFFIINHDAGMSRMEGSMEWLKIQNLNAPEPAQLAAQY